MAIRFRAHLEAFPPSFNEDKQTTFRGAT